MRQLSNPARPKAASDDARAARPAARENSADSSHKSDPLISALRVSAFVVPTSTPEADGTFAWTKTTMVLVEAEAGGEVGVGYSYANLATAELVRHALSEIVVGMSAMDVTARWREMLHAIRNLGRPGICAMAISAIDTALWDLKAKLLGVPLVKLFGAQRESVALYGSGGFTNYTDEQMRQQFEGWLAQGIRRVKMKIGSHPEDDPRRMKLAREIIGRDTQLFIDANGAFSAKQALRIAEQAAELDVRWFEEPVSSDDLEGLRLLRDRAPAGMDIAAGEYGYDIFYFRRMIEAGAVDVLQADATRCCGFTGFLQADTLCAARNLPLSAHCAPALHLHVCAAAGRLVHIEYFHDHSRIEQMFFDGVAVPREGELTPDLSRPGIGLELKRKDAERFAA